MSDRQDETPEYLATQQPPSAHAQGGDVIVTVTVFAPDMPAHAGQIRVQLTVPDAKHLTVQLRKAVEDAQRQGF